MTGHDLVLAVDLAIEHCGSPLPGVRGERSVAIEPLSFNPAAAVAVW